MGLDERRIRTLKLSSSDDSLLRQARYRLEEAFRTASLPGLPPNAQLLVRRLDFGAMRADQSPTLLANRITEMMRSLAATAVAIDQLSAAAANVVWYRDPLQPCTLLLARLLDGANAHEWYWRTLFPAQTFLLNSSTVEMVLSHAARTELKGMATARVLQQVLQPRRLSRLFSFISEELARRMLYEQGLSPVAVPAAKIAPHPGGDVETFGPANLPLIAAPTMALPWRQALQQAVACWGEDDVRTLWFAWHALVFHQPAWLERKDALQRIAPGEWLRSWAFNQTNVAVERESETATDNVVAEFNSDEAFAVPKDAASLSENRSDSYDAVDAALTLEISADSSTVPPLTAVDSSFKNAATEQQHDTDSTDATLRQRGIELSDSDSPTTVIVPFSPLAGFAFVIPLLQRIGIPELLARNESLIAIDLPRQLLWALAQRFGMAEDDPVRQLFEGFEPSSDLTIDQIQAPAIWQQLFTRHSNRGVGAAFLPRNVLGLSRQECRSHNESIQLRQLINTLQLLMALYLRRYCGLSWRTLMQRRGRVVLTATHWDVLFNINQTDLRLRRIALDSNPGWVAWLGRVVQFHYDNEG